VSQDFNARVRAIDIGSTTVQTIAGSTAGSIIDGSGTFARFHHPNNLEVSPDGGELLIIDYFNHAIRQIDLCEKPTPPPSMSASASATTSMSNSAASPPNALNASHAPWLSEAVKHSFAPHAECNETRSWKAILEESRNALSDSDRYVSGGLGKLSVEGMFHIWVCWKSHPCVEAVGGAADDRMCYVKDKADG